MSVSQELRSSQTLTGRRRNGGSHRLPFCARGDVSIGGSRLVAGVCCLQESIFSSNIGELELEVEDK